MGSYLDKCYCSALKCYFEKIGYSSGQIGPDDWNEANIESAINDLGFTPQDHLLLYGRRPEIVEQLFSQDGFEDHYFQGLALYFNELDYETNNVSSGQWDADNSKAAIIASGMTAREHLLLYGRRPDLLNKINEADAGNEPDESDNGNDLLLDTFENTSEGELNSSAGYGEGYSGDGLLLSSPDSSVKYSPGQFPSEGTFEAYVNIQDLNTNRFPERDSILDSNGRDAYIGKNNIALYLTDDKNIQFKLWGPTTEQSDKHTLTSQTTLDLDKWYSVGISWGSKGMHLYVNGDLEASDTNADDAWNNEHIYLGNCPDDDWAGGDYVNSMLGMIDSVRTSTVQKDINYSIEKEETGDAFSSAEDLGSLGPGKYGANYSEDIDFADQDFYKINVEKSGTLEISTDLSNQQGNIGLHIYNANHDNIGHSIQLVNGENFSQYNVEPGTYYINIYSASGTADYDLNLGLDVTQKLEGFWEYQTSNHWNTCNETPAAPSSGVVEFNQNGDEFTLSGYFEDSSVTALGNINGDKYTVTHTYPDGSGVTMETVDFELISPIEIEGEGSWNWTDGQYQCEGGYDVSAEYLGEDNVDLTLMGLADNNNMEVCL